MAETPIVEQVAARIRQMMEFVASGDPREVEITSRFASEILAFAGEHIAQQIEAVRDGRGEPVEIIRLSHAADIAREVGNG